MAPAGRAATARWKRVLVDAASSLGCRAHRGGPPECEPTSVRAVIRGEDSSSRCPWRRCVGPVDRGRPPRLDRGRSTRVSGSWQGARARRRGGASRSCRLATRGPKCGPFAAQARATADVSSTPRVRPPSHPPDCWRCPPPYEAPRPRPFGRWAGHIFRRRCHPSQVTRRRIPAVAWDRSGTCACRRRDRSRADSSVWRCAAIHGRSPFCSVLLRSAVLAPPRPIKGRCSYELKQQLVHARQEGPCAPASMWR